MLRSETNGQLRERCHAVGTDGEWRLWPGCADELGTTKKGHLAIKIAQDGGNATSTPHQPANAGFAPGLRLNVGEYC